MRFWKSCVLSLALGLILIVLPAPAIQAGPLASGFITGCTGEYFNNISLSGAPVLVRTDAVLDFFWPENTSPGVGVNTGNYSVRWTCTVNAPGSANYSFTITTDDGMNLLVDGALVIWAFYDQGPTSYSATVFLNAGAHTVRVEYYNKVNAGTAKVSSTLSSGVTPITDWQGEYFNNKTLSGAPVLVRNDPTINFNWGSGSPDPSVPANSFSARWTRTINFAGGTWRFTVAADDGVRLWIDGTLLIDKWIDQSYTGHTADIALSAGNHVVRVEYYENAGAAAVALAYGLLGAPPPPPPPTPGAWVGQYFNNVSLAGAPVLTRVDAAVNFNWGHGAPDPSVSADNFSVRWDSLQNVPTAGNHTVVVTSDDGVRVWIDGALVIDGWYDHVPTTFTATRYLTAGTHAVRVEYYERGGGAMITLQVNFGGPPPPIGEVIVDDRGPGWQAGGFSVWYNSPAGIGSHSFWTFNHTYVVQGYNWARWYPTLPGPGNYEVLAFIPGTHATTLNARYWIAHNSRFDLARRAQGFHPNQWISLGTYFFRALGGEYVSLASVTYECFFCTRVAFDAIRFVPR